MQNRSSPLSSRLKDVLCSQCVSCCELLMIATVILKALGLKLKLKCTRSKDGDDPDMNPFTLFVPNERSQFINATQLLGTGIATGTSSPRGTSNSATATSLGRRFVRRPAYSDVIATYRCICNDSARSSIAACAGPSCMCIGDSNLRRASSGTEHTQKLVMIPLDLGTRTSV